MFTCQTKGCRYYGEDRDDSDNTICTGCRLEMVDIEEDHLPLLLKFTEKGYRFREFNPSFSFTYDKNNYVDEDRGMILNFEWVKPEAFESMDYLILSRKVMIEEPIDKILCNIIKCLNMGICATFNLDVLGTVSHTKLDILLDEKKDKDGNIIAVSPGLYISLDVEDTLYSPSLLADQAIITEMIWDNLPRLLDNCEIIKACYDVKEFDEEDDDDEEW